MKIMFMGTPEIAATALKKLIDDGHNVVAAVTREDKPRGRGNVMTPTPVKTLAISHGIPVYTPSSLKTEEFSEVLGAHTPDIIVVVAYGKILPESVLSYPEFGCVNLHVSLLPKYRGAAPMQRAIMDGEKETGITIMYMDVGLDTGDIIACERFPISDDDDFESIHDRSAEIGSALLSKTLFDISNGCACRTKQDSSLATYAAKIEKDDCKIDFSRSACEVSARIRGVTPIPGAFAYLDGKMLKICCVSVGESSGKHKNVGEVTDVDPVGDGSVTVACGNGTLIIKKLKPEGKGIMSAGDFIRGRKIKKGDVLK